jgi:hypothetical protein
MPALKKQVKELIERQGAEQLAKAARDEKRKEMLKSPAYEASQRRLADIKERRKQDLAERRKQMPDVKGLEDALRMDVEDRPVNLRS